MQVETDFVDRSIRSSVYTDANDTTSISQPYRSSEHQYVDGTTLKGKLQRRWIPKKCLSILSFPSFFLCDLLFVHSLIPTQNTQCSRERNREHARKTRHRKKAHLESLKLKLAELQSKVVCCTHMLSLTSLVNWRLNNSGFEEFALLCV